MKARKRFRILSATDKGIVRINNEDNHCFSVDIALKKWSFNEVRSIPENSKGIVIAISDGMGGLEKGEVASQMAIDIVKEYFDKKYDQFISSGGVKIKQLLNELFIHINDKIVDNIINDAVDLGTTLVLVFVSGAIANIAWTGDSRCYLFNDDEGLIQATKDHSYVQLLVDKGEITKEQAFFHSSRNIITEYLGNPSHNPKVGFVRVELKRNDKILLCSDGLNSMLMDSTIEKILKTQENLEECAMNLINDSIMAGGEDNITIIIYG